MRGFFALANGSVLSIWVFYCILQYLNLVLRRGRVRALSFMQLVHVESALSWFDLINIRYIAFVG